MKTELLSGLEKANNMELKEQLISETKRWLEKIREERERIRLNDPGKKIYLENMDAYISDSRHFLEQGELIEAFEAVIWAWAYMTIGKEEGILERVSG